MGSLKAVDQVSASDRVFDWMVGGGWVVDGVLVETNTLEMPLGYPRDNIKSEKIFTDSKEEEFMVMVMI